MKFEFELDSIDATNLYYIFMREQSHIHGKVLDAENGLLGYVVDVPGYVRGCINELQQLDILVNKIHAGLEFTSSYMVRHLIDRYGENQYDADGEYTGHTEPTIPHLP